MQNKGRKAMPDEKNIALALWEERPRERANHIIDSIFQDGITRGIGIAIIRTFEHRFGDIDLVSFGVILHFSREKAERLLEASWDFQTADELSRWLDANA